MSTKKKTNTTMYIALALFFAIGFGSLIFSSLSENSTYFLTVSELLAMEPESAPKSARIFGTVAPGFTRSQTSTGLTFVLIDKLEKGKNVQVVYSGAIPDAFKEDAEVIAEGPITYMNNTTVMHATTIMAKCPSKYVEKSKQMSAEAETKTNI